MKSKQKILHHSPSSLDLAGPGRTNHPGYCVHRFQQRRTFYKWEKPGNSEKNN